MTATSSHPILDAIRPIFGLQPRSIEIGDLAQLSEYKINSGFDMPPQNPPSRDGWCLRC